MIRTTVTSDDLADLALAIKYEADGAVMRKELLQNLRKASKPALTGAKAAIMAMPATGLRNRNPSLRAAIAKEIKQETRLSAKSARIKIKVKRKAVRGLKDPAKRINSSKPWRHPVVPVRKVRGQYVRIPRQQWTWVAQKSNKPGWFDDEMRKHKAAYLAAVKDAMDKTASRIARKV